MTFATEPLQQIVEDHGEQVFAEFYSRETTARRQRPFGFATRACRVKVRRQRPKQSNPTTRPLATMNLGLRVLEADFGPKNVDIIGRDLHPFAFSNALNQMRHTKITLSQLESFLLKSADKLRGQRDASEFKEYTFGLLFLQALVRHVRREAHAVPQGLQTTSR